MVRNGGDDNFWIILAVTIIIVAFIIGATTVGIEREKTAQMAIEHNSNQKN